MQYNRGFCGPLLNQNELQTSDLKYFLFHFLNGDYLRILALLYNIGSTI